MAGMRTAHFVCVPLKGSGGGGGFYFFFGSPDLCNFEGLVKMVE